MELHNISTYRKNLGSFQLQFVAQGQYYFHYYDHVTYVDFFQFLKLYTLSNRRLYFDALFCFSLLRFKILPVFLHTADIRDFPRKYRKCYLISATYKNFPSARCLSAANRLFIYIFVCLYL